MLALTGLALVALSASVTPPAVRGPDAPPATIAGTWEVERVEMDPQDPSRWPLPHNDPRFVGRALVIAPGRVEIEGDKDLTCQQSTWPAHKSTWARLFAEGYLRPRPGALASPTPEDFGIVLPKTRKKTAAVRAQVLCPTKGSHAAAFPLNQWAAV